MNKIIIHISGPSGSGKTVLGNKLNDHFKNKIVVKDLDILRNEFINKTYDTSKSWGFEDAKYQEYIDNYIKKIKKPLIFVGLNDNKQGENKKLYYNVHSQYNYYIDIDDMVIVKQRCLRYLTDEIPNEFPKDKNILNDIVNNNEKFIKLFVKSIKRECSAKEIIKMNNKWKMHYKKHNYKFMTRENIYKSVVNIIK